MTNSSKWIAWIVVAAVVLGGGWWLLRSHPAATSNEPIKIGVILPLTGDAAAYGDPVQNGIKLAAEQINQAGGIDGRQVVMIYEDDKCDGQGGASAGQKLVNVDRVKYIIGPVCSSPAFGFEPITSAAKVFVLMPGASAAKLAGLSPYMMRNNPNDANVGIALAAFTAKSYKAVAVISEKTDYNQGIKDTFLAQAKQDGLAVVDTQDYDTNTSDFRSVLLHIKNANPDIVWINSQTGANLVRIAQQARQLGIKAQFLTAAFNDASVIAGGPALDEIVTAVAPGLSSGGEGTAFLAAYKAAYGTEPDFAFYAGAGYDDVYLLAQAITKVGDDTTKVEEYLHALPSYTGTIGTYHFAPDGDVVGINPVFQQLKGGKFVNL